MALNILYVEDNSPDIIMFERAMKRNKFNGNLYSVEDGALFFDFLNQNGKYYNMPRPDIIFLDLNIPKITGKEILKIIKSDDKFKLIPIIVLTTSRLEEDINECYSYYANAYIKKPIKSKDFDIIMKSIKDFWINSVELPSQL